MCVCVCVREGRKGKIFSAQVIFVAGFLLPSASSKNAKKTKEVDLKESKVRSQKNALRCAITQVLESISMNFKSFLIILREKIEKSQHFFPKMFRKSTFF